jgi:hypothetical protein
VNRESKKPISPWAGEAKDQLLYEEAESEEHSKVILIGKV